MLCQPSLKAPASVLLFTIAVSPKMSVATSAATPEIDSPPAYALRTAPVIQSRTRPEVDGYLVEGLQRWGLNE